MRWRERAVSPGRPRWVPVHRTQYQRGNFAEVILQYAVEYRSHICAETNQEGKKALKRIRVDSAGQ